jgi:hypothetical protein
MRDANLLARPHFPFLGLAAGFLTAGLVVQRFDMVTFGGGLPMSIALFAAMLIGKSKFSTEGALLRSALSAVVVSVTYPLSILVSSVGSAAWVTLAGIFNGGSVVPGGLFSDTAGLMIGAVLSATAFQLAVFVAGGLWEKERWLYFLAAGLGTVVLAVLATAIQQKLQPGESSGMVNPVFAYTLFPVGCASFATIFGHGLRR